MEDALRCGKDNDGAGFFKGFGAFYRRTQLQHRIVSAIGCGRFLLLHKEKWKVLEYRQGAVGDEPSGWQMKISPRTSSRTQSALLEVAEEGQATVDGVTRNIPEPFFVIATQNPLGSAGTQMLPESQMDRFMVLLSMGYPTIKEEMILMSQRKVSDPLDDVNEVISKEELLSMQKEVNEIKASR
ncbi:MAG: AAA family ATPase [Anaerobutyricum sp.]